MGGYINHDEVYSKKIRAGKRTYIFDVRETRNKDYYITISERKKRQDGDGIHKQKLFLYKEDFRKFHEALEEVMEHVKEDLLPEHDFEQYEGADDQQ